MIEIKEGKINRLDVTQMADDIVYRLYRLVNNQSKAVKVIEEYLKEVLPVA